MSCRSLITFTVRKSVMSYITLLRLLAVVLATCQRNSPAVLYSSTHDRVLYILRREKKYSSLRRTQPKAQTPLIRFVVDLLTACCTANPQQIPVSLAAPTWTMQLVVDRNVWCRRGSGCLYRMNKIDSDDDSNLSDDFDEVKT